MKNSKFIVIAAHSGSGKTTIVNKLIKEKELDLHFSVSATYRDPRKKSLGKNESKPLGFSIRKPKANHIC